MRGQQGGSEGLKEREGGSEGGNEGGSELGSEGMKEGGVREREICTGCCDRYLCPPSTAQPKSLTI